MEVVENAIGRISTLNNDIPAISNNIDTHPSDSIDAHDDSVTVLEAAHTNEKDVPLVGTVPALQDGTTASGVVASTEAAAVRAPDIIVPNTSALSDNLTTFSNSNSLSTTEEGFRMTDKEEGTKVLDKAVERVVADPIKVEQVQGTKLEEELQPINMKEKQAVHTGGDEVNLTHDAQTKTSSPSISGVFLPNSITCVTEDYNGGSVARRSSNKTGKLQPGDVSISAPTPTIAIGKGIAWKHGHEPPLTPHPPQKNKDTHYPYRPPRVDEKLYQAEITPLHVPVQVRSSDRTLRKGFSGGLQQQKATNLHQKDRDTLETGGVGASEVAASPPLELRLPQSNEQPGTGKQFPTTPSENLRPGQAHLDEYQVWNPAHAEQGLDNFLSYCRRLAVQGKDGGVETSLGGRGGSVGDRHHPNDDEEGDASTELKASKPLESDEMQLNWLKLHGGDVETACLHSAALMSCGTAQRSLDIEDHYVGNPRLQMGAWQARRLRRFAPLGGYSCTSDGLQSYGMVSHREDPTAPPLHQPNYTITTPVVSNGSEEGGGDSQIYTGSTNTKPVENGVLQEGKPVNGTSPSNDAITEGSPEKQQQQIVAAAVSPPPSGSATPPAPPPSVPTRSRASSELGRRGADRAEYKARWRNILRSAEGYILYANNQSSFKPSLKACIDILNDASTLPPPEQSPGEDFVSQVSAALAALSSLANRTRIWTSRVLDALSSKKAAGDSESEDEDDEPTFTAAHSGGLAKGKLSYIFPQKGRLSIPEAKKLLTDVKTLTLVTEEEKLLQKVITQAEAWEAKASVTIAACEKAGSSERGWKAATNNRSNWASYAVGLMEEAVGIPLRLNNESILRKHLLKADAIARKLISLVPLCHTNGHGQKKCPLSEIIAVSEELDRTGLRYPNTSFACERISAAKKWKKEAQAALDGKIPLKVLQSLVSESSLLSFDVSDISAPLVAKLDRAMEWLNRVKKAMPKKQRTTYTRGYAPPVDGYGIATNGTPAIEEDSRVNLNEARTLLEERGGHGVEVEAKEVARMSSLVETAEEWMGRVREVLEVGEEADLQALNDILMEADSIPVKMDEQQVLKVGIKVRQWKIRVAEAMGSEIDEGGVEHQDRKEKNGSRDDAATATTSTTEKKLISFAHLRSLSQEASVLRSMFPANARPSPIYDLLDNRRMQALLQKAESWVARAARLSGDLQARRLLTISRCTDLIAEASLLPSAINELDSWRVIKEAVAEMVPWMEKAADVFNGCGITVDKFYSKSSASPRLPLSCSGNESSGGVMDMAVDGEEQEVTTSETQGNHHVGNGTNVVDHPIVSAAEDINVEVEEDIHTTVRKIPFSDAQKCCTEAEQLKYGKNFREVRELRMILARYKEWKVTVDKLCPVTTTTQGNGAPSQHIEPQGNTDGSGVLSPCGVSELQKNPQGETSQPNPMFGKAAGGGNGGSTTGRRRRRQKVEEEGEEKYCKPKLQQFVDACDAGNELPIDVTEPLEQLKKSLDSAKQWKSKARETILNILKNLSSDTELRKGLKSVPPVLSCNSYSNSEVGEPSVLAPPPAVSIVPQPQLKLDRQSPQEDGTVVPPTEGVINPQPAVVSEISTSDTVAAASLSTTNVLPPTQVGEDKNVCGSVSPNNGGEEVSQSIGSAGMVATICEEDFDEKEEQYVDDLKYLAEEAKSVIVIVAEEELCEQLLDAITWAQDVRRLCVTGMSLVGSKGPTVKEAKDIAKAGKKSGKVVTMLCELDWEEEDIKKGLMYLQAFLKPYQDDVAPLADRLQASNEWGERAKKVMESVDTPPAVLRELLKQAAGMGFNNVELKKKIKAEVQKNNLWFQKAKGAMSGTACLTLSGTKKLVAEGEKLRGAADLVRQLKNEVKSAGKWLALVKKTGLQQGTATMAEIKALIPQAENIRVDLSGELKVLHLATSVHCICRRGATASSFMISCSRCHEQFHGHCLGIKKSDAENCTKLETYVCVMCRIVNLYRESEEKIIGAFKRWAPYASWQLNSAGAGGDGKFSELGRENFNALAKVMRDALQLPHEDVHFNVQVFGEVSSNISALDSLLWPPGPTGKNQYSEAKLVLQCLKTVLWATMAQWVFRGRPFLSTVTMLVEQASCLSIVDDELSSSLDSMAKRCLEWCNEARQLLQPPPPTQRDRCIDMNKLKKLSASVQLLPFVMKEENMIMTVLEDEGARYCICRAANDGGFMIGCDQCEVWYHGRCCSLSQSNSPLEFVCESCCEKEELKYPFPPMKAVPIPRDDEPLDTNPESGPVRCFEPLWPSRAVIELLASPPFIDIGSESMSFSHNVTSVATLPHPNVRTKVEQSSSYPFSPPFEQQNVQPPPAGSNHPQKDLERSAAFPAPHQEGKPSSTPSLYQGGGQFSLPYHMHGGSAGHSPAPTPWPSSIVQQGQDQKKSSLLTPNSLQQQALQQPSAEHLHPSSMGASLMADGISYPSAGVRVVTPAQWNSGMTMTASGRQFAHPPGQYERVNSNSWYPPTAQGYAGSNIGLNSIHYGDFGGGSKSIPAKSGHVNLQQQHQDGMGSVVAAQNTSPTAPKRSHVMIKSDISVSATSEGQANLPVDEEPLPKRKRDGI